MKFKDWFSIKGILGERRKINWLSKRDLAKDSFIVIAFCLVMGVFFFASDGLVAFIFNMLGLN